MSKNNPKMNYKIGSFRGNNVFDGDALPRYNEFKKEKADVIRHYSEFSDSDLQGVVQSMAKRYNVDEDDLLEEIKEKGYKRLK